MYSLSLLRLWKLGDSHVYSQLALQLEQKGRFDAMKGMFLFGVGTGPAFLSMPIRQAFVTLEKAYLSCLEAGKIEVC